jgi:osmotically-inducible protein OsmY
MKTKIFCASALVVAWALTASPALAAQRPDSWITLKTKIAMMTSEGIHATGLNVDTVKGVVTLHGKVRSEAEKTKAEEIAKSIEGAKSVKNLLQIVPQAAEDAVTEKDDVLKDHVDAAFKASPALKDSGISVASVNNGVVLLKGNAKSLDVEWRAIEIAHNVKGVRRVSSEVVVEEPKAVKSRRT